MLSIQTASFRRPDMGATKLRFLVRPMRLLLLIILIPVLLVAYVLWLRRENEGLD